MIGARYMFSLIFIAALSVTTFFAAGSMQDRSQTVLRDVGESVYSVQNAKGRGTAWAATTKSGHKVLVTNAHVCDMSQDGSMWTIKDGITYPVRVISKSSSHDICLLTAPSNAVPLKLATEVLAEETVYAVGFPIIEYMSSNRGVVKGYTQAVLPYDLPLVQCSGASKYSVRSILVRGPDGKLSMIAVCFFSGKVLATTANTDAGGSGSPMVNEDEEVIGMVMLRIGNIAWAEGVPLDELNKILDKY